METPGHTPGPWMGKWNGVYGSYLVTHGAVTVGTVNGVSPGIDTGTGRANARLIAAAPCLLEALLGLLDGLDANDDPERCGLGPRQWEERIRAAREAASRAAGRARP